ncbi:MAG: DAK2 domain-containing protein [Clostridia bacterium]|nr:DAK2 domain-containing protein [Clostridia bacterium]
MYQTMNGALFRAMIDYGIRNLALHSEEINDMNVFPVPDGDTGTNMVTTTRLGYRAIASMEGELPTLADAFAHAVVYGARGNSGVITSQFLRGFSEVFAALPIADGETVADPACFVRALQNGVALAYRAVTHPTEGTILTVVREATEAVARETHADLPSLLDAFLRAARVSLDNTPNLLPILRNAGVVDSGGVGIICFFEGMSKYLNHEKISRMERNTAAEASAVDYGRFGRDSEFPYGYCTEGLLQLTNRKESFVFEDFRAHLDAVASSVVVTEDGDKVKFHAHTDAPEAILAYAHAFGEFLSLKIENMTVQNAELPKKVMTPKEVRDGSFGIVAAAPNERLGERFLAMGADAVISASNAMPATGDFLDAFSATRKTRLLVFPNHKNLILAAEQARDLAQGLDITVIDSKSIAHCYASRALIDLDGSAEDAIGEIAETVRNVYSVSFSRAVKEAHYGALAIADGDFIAMTGNSVIAVGKTLAEVATRVIDDVMHECERDTVTFFLGDETADGEVEKLEAHVRERYLYTETDLVTVGTKAFDLILSFE